MRIRERLSRCLGGIVLLGLAGAASAEPAARPDQSPPPAKPGTEEKVASPCRAGFQEMAVLGLMPSEQGQAVVLKHPTERLLLPIWIGPAEAFSIQLRLERKRFQRPLTHDLWEDAVKQLGGRLVQVQVDDLKDNTFVGTVFLQQGERALQLDARPSDAIALALGARVPICVSLGVLERAGVRDEKGDPARPAGPTGSTGADKLLRDILDAQPDDKNL